MSGHMWDELQRERARSDRLRRELADEREDLLKITEELIATRTKLAERDAALAVAMGALREAEHIFWSRLNDTDPAVDKVHRQVASALANLPASARAVMEVVEAAVSSRHVINALVTHGPHLGYTERANILRPLDDALAKLNGKAAL